MTSGAVSIDRETVSQYTLTVIACQHAADAGDSWSSCATNVSLSLSIKVFDVNDNSPQFDAPFYSITLVSDAPRGSRVIQLTAVDRDEPGHNSLITYHLDSHLFTVDALTGWVTVIDSLTDVGEGVLTLWVVAEDHGSPVCSSRTSVHVNVLSQRRRPVITAPQHNATVLVGQVNTHTHTHTHTHTAGAPVTSQVVGCQFYH